MVSLFGLTCCLHQKKCLLEEDSVKAYLAYSGTPGNDEAIAEATSDEDDFS
jgi:hypothetical protein